MRNWRMTEKKPAADLIKKELDLIVIFRLDKKNTIELDLSTSFSKSQIPESFIFSQSVFVILLTISSTKIK